MLAFSFRAPIVSFKSILLVCLLLLSVCYMTAKCRVSFFPSFFISTHDECRPKYEEVGILSSSFSLFLSLSIVYWYLKRHQTGHFLFILYSPPYWIFFLFFTYCRTGSNPSDFCSLLFVYVLRRISSLEIFLILFSLSCVVLIRVVLGGSFHIRRPENLFFPSSGNLWDCRVYCTMRCVNSNHELLDNIIDSW